VPEPTSQIQEPLRESIEPLADLSLFEAGQPATGLGVPRGSLLRARKSPFEKRGLFSLAAI
jgi:hypothetical protein